MKVAAIYRHEIMDEDGVNDRDVHAIDHDGGAFLVSSKEVGVAIQNFIHYATLEDIFALHNFLLYVYAQRWMSVQLTVPPYEGSKKVDPDV